MVPKEKILQAIYATIDEFNEQLTGASRIAKSPESVLFGQSGSLDSLNLVNFIVAVEQNIEKEAGVAVVLTDTTALSQRNSPFQTVSTLTDYIHQLLEKSGNG